MDFTLGVIFGVIAAWGGFLIGHVIFREYDGRKREQRARFLYGMKHISSRSLTLPSSMKDFHTMISQEYLAMSRIHMEAIHDAFEHPWVKEARRAKRVYHS